MGKNKLFLDAILGVSAQPIFIKDWHGTYLLANDAMALLLGRKRGAELEGRCDDELFGPKEAKKFQQDDQEVLSSKEDKHISKESVRDARGHIRWFQTTRSVLYPEKPKEQRLLLGIATEITELVQANETLSQYNEELIALNESEVAQRLEMSKKKNAQEVMLIQQSKMAAMGDMINAIAHQWKQPLNAISLITQGFKDRREWDEEISIEEQERDEQKILEQVEFMNETLDSFRNFFRPSREKQRFHPCCAIEEVQNMILPQYRADGISMTILPHAHREAEGYLNEFKQVILNILSNARDIINEKKIQPGIVEVAIDSTPETMTIRIRDNGGGIPEALLPEKIFEAHFSTKGEKGTGIGLQICKTIIEEKMGGQIYAHNREQGAEFVITLPLADRS